MYQLGILIYTISLIAQVFSIVGLFFIYKEQDIYNTFLNIGTLVATILSAFIFVSIFLIYAGKKHYSLAQFFKMNSNEMLGFSLFKITFAVESILGLIGVAGRQIGYNWLHCHMII